MLATPNLNFTVVEPTKESLKVFVSMLRSVYQHLTDVINGKLGFGDGTNSDNISGTWINVVAPVAPNTDFTVNHNLGRLPVGYLVMEKDRACDVYTGSVAATQTAITLRATVASTVLRLFIICLLLCLIAVKSEAQGALHYQTAFKTVTTPGNLGIGGGVVTQPVAGAVITVCNGSTLPATGVTCSGLATIYSCITLSSCTISNPTNADSNGNYVFYVSAPASYVVSVSGVGLTTYSYVLTAPYVNGSTVALTNATNLVGPGIVTGNYTHTGTETFNGLIQCKNFENVFCVDSTNSAGWAGADYYAWTNSAYAALPYVGTGTGKVDVYPPPGNTCPNVSTPLSIATNNKPVVVDFHGTCFNDTRGSGATPMMLLDTGGVNTIVSSSLRNFHLIGNGANIGYEIGVPGGGNGCQQCTVDQGEVDGYPTLAVVGAQNAHINHPKLNGTGLAGSVCLSAQQSDDLRIYGGSINSCAKLIAFDTSNTGPIEATAVSFVEAKGGSNTYISATAAAPNAPLYFINCHFAALTQVPLFLNATSGMRVFFIGSTFEDDINTGALEAASYMTASGAGTIVTFIGADASSSNSVAAVNEFILSSTGALPIFLGVFNHNPTQIPLLYNRNNAATQLDLALTLLTNIPNPTDAGATYYNQSGVGPTVSGAAISLRAGASTPAEVLRATPTSINMLFPPESTGTQAVLTGTGACATITTQHGGSWAGDAKCTGVTGASTLTITFATTAPNGWVCDVWDETTRANVFQQTSHSPTTCVMTITSVTANDVFVFKGVAY